MDKSSNTAAAACAPNRNETVWAIVGLVPEGSVATYGQIAALAGLSGPTGARQVGYALAGLPFDSTVPWHRVINAEGKISPRADPDAAIIQRSLLEDEGVEFGLADRIVLERYRWKPESAS